MPAPADARSQNLTGVWHGLYSYPAQYKMPESHFVATLIDGGAYFSGTIHEVMRGRDKEVPANAMVEGTHDGNHVTFVKTYDGTSGHSHSLMYDGQLSSDATEIEGTWRTTSGFSGTFLMIRNRGSGESVSVKIAEEVH